GAALRDVHRARVAIAPGGRPLRVHQVARWTDTPSADEHDLVARGDRIAWVTRGAGGEHGVTVEMPTHSSRLERIVDALTGVGLPARMPVHVVMRAPTAALQAELRDEGILL